MATVYLISFTFRTPLTNAEGALSFDPKNAEQVKIALKLAGVKAKRRVSPEERARLQAIGYKRGSPALGDGLTL